MNWKLILQLSMFGLAMGLATVFFIPSNIEPAFWLAIFLFCALTIAAKCDRNRFLTGLCLGIVNSVWITTAHALLATQYLANHPQEAEMMKQMPMGGNPRAAMMFVGPFVGVISGVLIGLLTLIAATIFGRKPSALKKTAAKA